MPCLNESALAARSGDSGELKKHILHITLERMRLRGSELSFSVPGTTTFTWKGHFRLEVKGIDVILCKNHNRLCVTQTFLLSKYVSKWSQDDLICIIPSLGVKISEELDINL